MSAALLIDSLLRSFQVGSLYALMAIGLTLTLAVIRLPNFAHAELITIGAYVALVASTYLTSNLLLTLCLSFIFTALVAVASHKIVYEPLQKINSSIHTLILASFALGLIPRYIIFLLIDFFDTDDYILREGQIIFQGSAAEILVGEETVKSYLGVGGTTSLLPQSAPTD